MVVPTLDFAKFMNGTVLEQEEVAKQITDSFIKHGFVKLLNHGVSSEMVDNVFHWSKKLFHMTPEQKRKFSNIPSASPQRGYSHLNAEATAPLREENVKNGLRGFLTDEKEHFDCGPPDDQQYPNRWPDPHDLPGFREFMESYFMASHDVAMDIMRACELGLVLPEGTLTTKCVPPSGSEVRLIHYPTTSLDKFKSGLTKRCWPHTDIGIVTLLFQDKVGGLELEDRSRPNTFIPVPNEHPYEMVVNTSDSFQRWTNGIIPTGVHQVVSPIGMKDIQEGELPDRYSAAFFMKADRAASLGPLPQFIGPQKPPLYEDITALEYHKLRNAKLY